MNFDKEIQHLREQVYDATEEAALAGDMETVEHLAETAISIMTPAQLLDYANMLDECGTVWEMENA